MDVITRTVDARGQSCPGPLVALARALKDSAQSACSSSSRPIPAPAPTCRAGRRSPGTSSSTPTSSSGEFRYMIRKA